MQHKTGEHTFSIIQVIDRLNTGGTERVLVTLSNLLSQKGHKVSVLTTVAKGPLAVLLNENINIVDLKRRWKWNPLTMYRLVRQIKKYDIVHVHSSYNLRYIFLAATIFRLKKVIFFHEHFGDININQAAPWHTKYIYPKTIFIAVSRQLAAWAVEKVGVPAYNVFVLPNIIAKTAAGPSAKKNDNTELLVVSNIRPTKNIEFAITVFEELVKTHKRDYHLTIIGTVADKDYYEMLTRLVKGKNLQNKISFVHDCISVQSVLPNFDLALHTATSESGPLVLIEYMAQGLPFITHQTGEVVHQIQTDLLQCIVQSFDVNEWVNCIEHLLQTDKKLLQQQLQKFFDLYYSADAYYEKCLHIYNTGLKL